MPTKRRKRGIRRYGHMTDVQRLHLICGAYLLPCAPSDEFVDEEHRRETWRAHRDEILAGWDHPGQRPAALWAYDCQLKRAPYPRMWSWPRPIETEEQMVHRLLTEGVLASCRPDEREVIEERWLMLLGGHMADRVPAWFQRQHARTSRSAEGQARLHWPAGVR